MQLFELYDCTTEVCCLVRTGIAEPENGSIMFEEQKGAECCEACRIGYTDVGQPPTGSIKERQIKCIDSSGYIEDQKAAH